VSRYSINMTEWERIDPGHYVCGDRVILRVGSATWELSGMVIDTSRHRSLKRAMDASDLR
jgi:hypothetical protein